MRKIIITGATSGIGQGFKQYFENLGDMVFDISRNGEDYRCDTTDRKGLERIFHRIEEGHGQVDMLIHCAGYGLSGAIELVPEPQVQKQFDVNVIGTVNCLQLVLPMLKPNGKIIVISSVCALFPIPFRGYYCASKAAVSSIIDSLRMELSKTNIQVTAICPSDIKTNFTKHREKVYETNERYQDAIRLSTEKLDKNEHKRMPLDKAIRIMTRWIEQKHLKPQYIMTFKFKLLYFCKGLFPKSWYLKLCDKMFHKTK